VSGSPRGESPSDKTRLTEFWSLLSSRSQLRSPRGPLGVAAATVLVGLAAAVHYYGSASHSRTTTRAAHLVVARRVFDSLTPGWQQVRRGPGLPLPHLLNALPVQIDWLYRTGFSAIAISIASMALAAWAIAALIHRATGR